MRRTITILIIATLLLAPVAAFAQDWLGEFEANYERIGAGAVFSPSPLARRIALAVGLGDWQALPPQEAAMRAFGLAAEAEKALRFGASAQETHALLRQRYILSSKSRVANRGFAKAMQSKLRSLDSGPMGSGGILATNRRETALTPGSASGGGVPDGQSGGGKTGGKSISVGDGKE